MEGRVRIVDIAAAGVLAAALLAGATSAQPLSATGPLTTAGPQPAGPAADRPAPAPPGLLVVGASYTQGLGAWPQSAGYAYRLGGLLGRRTEVDGVAGTGFLNPGAHQQGTYAQRISRERLAFRPGLVLIQCGRNDAGAPSGTLFTAVGRTIALTRDRYRGADITMLGPIPDALPVRPPLTRLDALYRSAARANAVRYIDPMAEHWISPVNLPGYRGRVPGHPNNAGYSYLAGRVAADLRTWQTGHAV